MPNPKRSKNLDQALKKANVTLPEQTYKRDMKYYKGVVSVLDPVTTNFKPSVKTDVIVMVSDGVNFQLPQKVFKTIFDDMKKGSEKIRMSYSSKSNYSKVIIHKGYEEAISYSPGLPDVTSTAVLDKENITISVSRDNLSNLVWGLDMGVAFNPQGNHSQIVANFSYTSKENTEVTKSVLIAYNSTPTINASTVVYNANDITVEDRNGDFVSAYEIKLVNEKNAGKVDLVIKDLATSTKETYTIGKEGIRLSTKDLRSNLLQFNRRDGYIPQKGLAAGDVKVSVSACDEFGWGPRQVLHAPLSK